MPIRVALHHKTSYSYDQVVQIFPQILRLRPAPHARTPILSYSLKVEPGKHFINWQQDPQGNYLARLVFTDKADHLSFEVDLVAEMTVINPFDFFVESYAENFPFAYEPWLQRELRPYLELAETGPLLTDFVNSISRDSVRIVDFLVPLNQRLQQLIGYTIRMEPGVQTCEQTLEKKTGSCRDSAWLLVQVLRQLGLAARFVSGYLIQLAPDEKPLDGPAGPTADFTDLHAWAEVYLPGAGWIGLDPTSGLFAGEGHIPLACTPDPFSAAPITGSVEPCESKFNFEMSVTRVHEDPRVTKPYSEEQWADIIAVGQRVDTELEKNAVRLTMGGEPTFVSADDMESEEWNTAAVGPTKRLLSSQLIQRLRNRFALGGLLHYGQGKWYPGEQLPRYAFGCYWRRDGVPIWSRPNLIADENIDYGHGPDEAKRFGERLAQRLGVSQEFLIAGYEDAWHYMLRERRLPINVDPLENKIEDAQERERISKVFEQGLRKQIGFALPLERRWGGNRLVWASGPWFLRREHMFLIPGDSPMGFRLPLDSLPWVLPTERNLVAEWDPMAKRPTLPTRDEMLRNREVNEANYRNDNFGRNGFYENAANNNGFSEQTDFGGYHQDAAPAETRYAVTQARGTGDGGSGDSGLGGYGSGPGTALLDTPTPADKPTTQTREEARPWFVKVADGTWVNTASAPYVGQSAPWIIRSALCIEPRHGRLHVFMPPCYTVEDYLDLITQIEETAAELNMPVIIEGYTPPNDPRLNNLKVTPDPGVIEVNMQPAHNWNELVNITSGIYEDARQTRLGCNKFMVDGRHTGTGGGNHIVMGGATPAESPFLRRPDLLRSLLAYWNNHPSLSYLLSGLFIGPTSQAPRIDEGRHEQLYELDIAFQQLQKNPNTTPWLVDRLFRNILTDMSGNTHRAEFCIDKLYSPDSPAGRLGLVEFRAFEMPPHDRMSLAQQLLLRALVARFWKQQYHGELVHWGTRIHDKFMLPYFIWQDFRDVINDLRDSGFNLDLDWFKPHFEFRFPLYGEIVREGVQFDLRCALEPWLVLGEEGSAGGTVRYVDSSVERVQVHIRNHLPERYVVTCNQRAVPLHPTGVAGEYVAGVRYRAWQPPSCMHPTIGVHTPLVFDIYDKWSQRSLGGCQWHVMHPGGRSYDTYPVNANEAEARRNARFFTYGHTGGSWIPPRAEVNSKFPMTLDLRYSEG
jgi:uncharacterized protein (DUF2126 family)/transglutaminase-like putative cysteine protease